jgi:uracil-DNA glycosylase
MPDRQRSTKGQGARRLSLAKVERDAADCQRCDLWRRGTQTVFGAGPSDAAIVFVGEQPGDVEDREGEPFVGPAGRLLRESLAEAGIDADAVYFTNAVKHFKWRASGKRRIHERPNREEILACRMWLDAEIALLKPKVLVALGTTAASVILPAAKVMRDRAKVFASPLAKIVTVTVHPSSILRAPDPQSRTAARRRFVQDLRKIARMGEHPHEK